MLYFSLATFYFKMAKILFSNAVNAAQILFKFFQSSVFFNFFPHWN